MEIRRTIRIRLRPDQPTAELLARTVEACTASFNEVSRFGWSKGIANGVELHKATYHDHRARFGLPSQLACQARVKATEALKSAKELAKKGKKVRMPQSKACPIRYDVRSYTLWFNRSEVSLLTLDGRTRLPFKLPDHYAEYATWKPACADLIRDRKGRWWLHVVMATEAIEVPANGEYVGVDLGIAKPAADSRGNFYGSDHWKVVEDRIFQLRRRLQAKGSRSAKRHLKRLSGRQARFRRDCDHVLSKRLVRSVSPGTTLVFEDLTNIRGRAKARSQQRRRLHGWSFHQLQAFVEYRRIGQGSTWPTWTPATPVRRARLVAISPVPIDRLKTASPASRVATRPTPTSTPLSTSGLTTSPLSGCPSTSLLFRYQLRPSSGTSPRIYPWGC